MMPIRKKLLAGGGIMNQLTDLEKLKGKFELRNVLIILDLNF